eukprot:gene5699-11491_t
MICSSKTIPSFLHVVVLVFVSVLLQNVTSLKFSNNIIWGSIRCQSLFLTNIFARKAWTKSSLSLTSRKANGIPKSDIAQPKPKFSDNDSQILYSITQLIEKGDRKLLWNYVDSNLPNLTKKHINDLLFQTSKHSIQVPSHYLLKIANILENTNQFITAKEISGIMYSFKTMKYEAKDMEMNTLLSFLVGKLQDPKTRFNAKQFSMAISLTQLIQTSTCELTIQDFSSAFYGLQLMSGDSLAVRQLLSALSHKLEVNSSNVELTDKSVGMILYGLQGMSAEYKEVRNLLRILTTKILCSRFEFKGRSLGMALYGLQGMSSEFEEVKLLLKSLHEKMGSDMTLTLDGQAAGNALYGISNMRCDDDGNINRLVTRLTECILAFTETMSSSSNAVPVTVPDLLTLYQSTALALRGLPGLDTELRGKLEVARDLLLDLLNERRVEVSSSKSSSSEVERRVADLVSQILSSQLQCTVSVNEFLFGFEADVVMRLDSGKTLNLEVDGPIHEYPSKKRFCSLRDDLLREKNVLVIRLSTRDIDGLSQSDLREKLKIMVAEYI